MKYFIIGDVHGCVNTYKSFLDQYWNPQKEIVVQVGDIANKGKYTLETILFSIELSQKYPQNFIQLKGNNDHLFYKKIKSEGFSEKEIELLNKKNITKEFFLEWLDNLPHFFDSKNLFISHAGVDKKNNYPVKPKDLNVIYTRESLKNIGKKQVIGHVLVKTPSYDGVKNIWYLDTGAGFGKKLSGIKIKKNGKVTDIISTEVKKKDKLK